MDENEESRRTDEGFVSKYMSLPAEEIIEIYRQMSVNDQGTEFVKIVNALNAKHIEENESNKRFVWLLMFFKFTNPRIIPRYTIESMRKKNDLGERIMLVANLFKECIEKLNEVPNEKLFLFVDRMSTSEIDSMNIFIHEMLRAFMQYPLHSSDSSIMIMRFMDYTHHYSQALQQRKNWISEMVEDYRSGGRKSKAKVVEEGKKAFKDSTEKYKCSGWGFLALTFVVAVILLLWGLQLAFNIFHFSIPSDNSYLSIASSIVGKIIISATLFFLLGAFSKSYFACKHNETICRQRHDVLSSYEDIYTVVDEKKFVLQKVAEAVFDQLPTGFSKLQTDKGDSSISLADIVNMLQKSSDKGKN